MYSPGKLYLPGLFDGKKKCEVSERTRLGRIVGLKKAVVIPFKA